MAKKKSAKKKTTRKKSSSDFSELDFSNLWPQERDYITRPERLKYVRKLIKNDGCVFCDAWKKPVGFESLVLFKNKHAMVILNKFPYNTGHVMVIPKIHKGSLMDLSEATHLEATKLVRKTVDVLQKAYEPAGFNVGLNQGRVAGAGIPDHLHWHIIPRWFGDTNFFPLIAETKVLPEDLDQTYTRLRKYFK